MKSGGKVLALLFVLGCHPQVRQPDASLLLRVQPAQAVVYVDDILAPIPPGQGQGRVLLRPGLHRVEVRADGWFTAYREVSLSPGAVREVEFTLRKDPDAPDDPAAEAPGSAGWLTPPPSGL